MTLYYQLGGKYYKTTIQEAKISFSEIFTAFNDVVMLNNGRKMHSSLWQRVSVLKHFSEQQVPEAEVDEDVKEAIEQTESKDCVFINKALKIKKANINKLNISAFENLNFISTGGVRIKYNNWYGNVYGKDD